MNCLSGRGAGVLSFLILLFTWPLFAHHYKGLPHYSYFENYPQIPALEYIEANDSYEVFVTIYNFQGMNLDLVESPDDVRFYVFISELRSGDLITSPVQFDVYSDDEIVHSFGLVDPEQENIFVLQAKIEEQEKLSLKASFDSPQGVRQVVSVSVALKKTFLQKYGLAAAVLLFFLLVMLMKISINLRKRRQVVTIDRSLEAHAT